MPATLVDAPTPLAEPGTGTRSVAPARRVRGRGRVPGDKSITHRAVLFNALAEGVARVADAASGADGASTVRCLRALGVRVEAAEGSLLVHGAGLRGLREPEDVLDCGNSGTTMRLLSGVLAGQDLFAILSGDASLRGRPMARVLEPLRAMGARVAGRDGDRLPPLVVQPAGRLQGIRHTLPVASAQLKSALLLAGLLADGQTEVHEPSASRDHTERMLAAMGASVRQVGTHITLQPAERLRATDVRVPGDFSSAAFWLVLACLHPDAELAVEGVGVNPTRTGLLEVLRQMGADVEVRNARDEGGEPVADLVARSSRLTGTQVGGDLVPLAIDELPLVALLGTFAKGETLVRDAAELRVKESDRVAAVADGLNALGGHVTATPDGWHIQPARLRAGRADSRGDHRIAMLLALAGALGQGAQVDGAAAVSVSYPGFWDNLAEVTAA